MTRTGVLAERFADVIGSVDETIGENRTYGEGIGPHDEDNQIDALVSEVEEQGVFDGSIYTAKSDASDVRYPGGQSADIVIEAGGDREFCEAKLFRFQKANSQPSSQGFSKVFSPYQDRNPRSFVHDVSKLADADVRAMKTFLAPYYRPVDGPGSEITGQEIAAEFVDAVEKWTNHEIVVDTVAPFSGLQHDVLCRGAILAWELADQPDQYF
ncbi:hypothetical protein [Halobacterium hubeiense]|uniref:hypothetical protein n=1 Tax=Halobacterium hubeiense TaxID=1407499 RepID=UPI00073F7B70|nr:hypothetical protein [Halobacterium hubeiense]